MISVVDRPYRILITSAQVPFTQGGAEVLAAGLRRELQARGHLVDLVQLPFNALPKEVLLNQIALWRALDLSTFSGQEVDLVIATKFPSYIVSHRNKVVWLVHQHRQIYDLYGSDFGDFRTDVKDEQLRRMITTADETALKECRSVFTISGNVADRLARYLGVNGVPLLPPLPLGDRYRSAAPQNYILSVGRLCTIKRVDLLIKALPQIGTSIVAKIVGQPDEPGIERYLHSEIEKHHLGHRVEFLGRVDDQQLIDLYANALAVYYAPYDEDYGFVTLEALASGRPVVTASDSGGVLEFIVNEKNGLVVAPNEAAIASAFNRLRNDRDLYSRLAAGAAASPVPGSWEQVIEALTASLACSDKTRLVNSR